MGLRSYLGCSAAIISSFVLGVVPANAQNFGGASPNIESVTVTGSRISIRGYEAPTPVTVVNTQDLQRNAFPTIEGSLVQLPSVGISATPNNGVGAADLVQADAGLSTVNLRDLGVERTLVLFDGQRVVSSNILEGGVDLSTIPSELVKRIEVVTGGASASYGSDAVAGVVNLILDKTFTGVKGNVQFGNTTTAQRREIKAALTVGSDFAGGRGHFIVSGDHIWDNDPVFMANMKWYNNAQIVQNPAATATNGEPYFIGVRNAGTAEYTQGGLIVGNTAGGAGSSLVANSLTGTQFVGHGNPVPFHYGTVDATNPNVCYAGCSANARNSEPLSLIGVPYHSTTLFGYVSYDLTPDTKVSLQLNYGALREQNTGTPRTTRITIYPDNAYLPKSIASQFGTLSNGYDTATGLGGTAAAPTQFLTLASKAQDNVDTSKPLTMAEVCNTTGEPCLFNRRALTRGVLTFQGALGGSWTWNAYAEYSKVRQHETAYDDNYKEYYGFATDAVAVTPTNVGTSGLPVGSVQCRATLEGNSAASDCVPLDIFGTGVASQEAIDYVQPGRNPESGILNQDFVTLNQSVFSASAQGVLPWGLPAGKVATAFGADYRHEQAKQFGMPAIDAHSPFPAGNFSPYGGQYEVEEGFLEVSVPVLKNDVVESLGVDAAGRITNYSTSGLVETWKLGLNSQIDDNVRIRGTWSLDIRAPSINELFSTPEVGIGSIQYPTNGQTYQDKIARGGNPNLKPEKAVTTSFGVVLTPQFIPGLSASVDWYNINIHGAIYTTGTQTIIDRCLQGQSVYCTLLKFSPDQFGGTVPYEIDEFPANAASIKTSGIDLQANYTMPLFMGTLMWDLRGNYMDEYTQDAIGITYDSAGAEGSSPFAYDATGLPKARGILSATYTQGPWSGTVQGRFFGAAVLTNGIENLPASITRGTVSSRGVVNGNEISVNDVDPTAYLDLRASYQWREGVSLYGAVDNVTSVPPPEFGSRTAYDVFGKSYRVGIRFNY